jgi:hypothetical protein
VQNPVKTAVCRSNRGFDTFFRVLTVHHPFSEFRHDSDRGLFARFYEFASRLLGHLNSELCIAGDNSRQFRGAFILLICGHNKSDPLGFGGRKIHRKA